MINFPKHPALVLIRLVLIIGDCMYRTSLIDGPRQFVTSLHQVHLLTSGPSSLGVPGVPWHTQILADQLTLSQPGETNYAHLITTGTSGFSDLPTALDMSQ